MSGSGREFTEWMQSGDLDALVDPLLPLYLFTDPGGEWWVVGRKRAAIRLRSFFLDRLSGTQVAMVLREWSAAWGLKLNDWHIHALEGTFFSKEDHVVGAMRGCLGQVKHTHHVDFLRRLHTLLPWTQEREDRALAVLECFRDG